ncbi:hypothetical protein Tco_0039107 [Tanacetum coccineum]
MDFPEFYKELVIEISFIRFGYHVHLGFHLLLIGLGANGSPLSGYLGLPLVDSLVPMMAHETKRSFFSSVEALHTYGCVHEQKLHHLEEALPESPPTTTTTIVRNAYTCRVAEQQEVACLMSEEDQSISTYMLKMKGYLDQMKHLGYPMPLVLGVNLLLSSLSKDYDQYPKKALFFLAIRQASYSETKLQARGNGGKKEQEQEHIHENMKSYFNGGVYKEMLWNAVKATSVGDFNKKMAELKSYNSSAYDWWIKIQAEQWSRSYCRAKCDILLNNICEVFNRQLVDSTDQPIITCLEYIREYLMKRIVVVQKVIAKTVRPLTLSVTAVFDAIKRTLGTLLNGMEEVGADWNTMEMWPVVESITIIIPPNYKPHVGRLLKKRKKSHDEITRKSCSSDKLSRKGKSVKCTGGAKNVSGQAAGARNASSQAGGSSQPSAAPSTTTGAKNASSQATGASQPSAAPSTASQGPTQHST